VTTSPAGAMAAPATADASTGMSAAEPAPGARMAAATAEPTREADGRLVAAGNVEADAATPEEAVQAVRAAEDAYLRAYSRYAELTSGQQRTDDPVARAAALESIVLTTRAALDRAPADPVINGYHLTAVAQRDAALRQIALRSSDRWF